MQDNDEQMKLHETQIFIINGWETMCHRGKTMWWRLITTEDPVGLTEGVCVESYKINRKKQQGAAWLQHTRSKLAKGEFSVWPFFCIARIRCDQTATNSYSKTGNYRFFNPCPISREFIWFSKSRDTENIKLNRGFNYLAWSQSSYNVKKVFMLLQVFKMSTSKAPNLR